MGNLTCPVWYRSHDEKGRPVRKCCGEPAKQWLVSGLSYQCKQVLCDQHAKQAIERDKFAMVPVETPVQTVNASK
jgi:hypothetical protein